MADTNEKKDNQPNNTDNSDNLSNGGTYEIIKKRLIKLSEELFKKITQLNEKRKDVFGKVENKIIKTDRIITDNNCIPRDIRLIGNKLIFGYIVNTFLKETQISDVFNIYQMKENSFVSLGTDFLNNEEFKKDFRDTYNYYKNARFATFRKSSDSLLMVFQIGRSVSDIKVFKWAIDTEGNPKYLNNRSDREYKIPNQHDFIWKETTREQQVQGKHPHISIEDIVFVECIGGDLTVKIEDNTEVGTGIYSEDVINADQTLEDAQIYYSIIDTMVVLKILPYQEKDFRYIIYNTKTQTAIRLDDIEQCAIRLPEGDGFIFYNGYYLKNG